MSKSTKPGPDNSAYKMWILLADGTKMYRYSFPVNDHRGANEQYKYMVESVLNKELKNNYVLARFYDFKLNRLLYEISPNLPIVPDKPRYMLYVNTGEIGLNEKGFKKSNKRYYNFPSEQNLSFEEIKSKMISRILYGKFNGKYKYAELTDNETKHIHQFNPK